MKIHLMILNELIPRINFKMNEKESKLKGFKEEYEQLVIRFTEFIKNEFTKK